MFGWKSKQRQFLVLEVHPHRAARTVHDTDAAAHARDDMEPRRGRARPPSDEVGCAQAAPAASGRAHSPAYAPGLRERHSVDRSATSRVEPPPPPDDQQPDEVRAATTPRDQP